MAPFTASTMNIKIFQALTPRTIGSLVCSNICLWHVQSGAISSHNRVRDTACSVVAYPDHKGVMRASASLAPKHRLTMASTQHLAAVHFDWVRKWWHNGTIVLKGTQQPERGHSDEERRSFNHRWLGVSEATRNNLTMSDFKMSWESHVPRSSRVCVLRRLLGWLLWGWAPSRIRCPLSMFVKNVAKLEEEAEALMDSHLPAHADKWDVR